MKQIKQLYRVGKLDQLIRNKQTGSPSQLAQRLSISRSQLYNYIDTLKHYGAELCFDRKINSFKYLEPFEIKITVDIQVITKEAAVNIYAGSHFQNYSFSPMTMDGARLDLVYHS